MGHQMQLAQERALLALKIRVQRFPQKPLVLQDKSPSNGTHPALIFTCPFFNQFKLKESQNRDFLPPILVDYWS